MTIKLNKLAIAGAACSAIFAGLSVPAFADTSSIIDKLYEKGVLNDEDYAELNKEAKDERREAAEKSAKDSDPNKVSGKWKDGIKFESKDKQFGIQLAGRVQQDLRFYDNSNAKEGAYLRRAYFGLKGHVYGDWKFEVTNNIAANTNEYAFLEYAGNPAAKIRMGNQKFFYSFEEQTSSRFVDFIERSFVNSFDVGKDRGIQVYGEPQKNKFGYSVALLNGKGQNTDEGNAQSDGFDTMLAFKWNATGDAGKKDGKVLHVEVAQVKGTQTAGSPGSLKTEAAGDTFFTWTTPGASFDRTKTNVSLVGIWGPLKLQTERNTMNVSTSSLDQDVKTSYIAASWLLTGERYADNYSMFGMKGITPQSQWGQAGGTGAWEIGIRHSSFDAKDLGSSYFSGTDKASATTVGLKWIPNSKVRVVLNYVKTSFEDAITDVDTVTNEDAWMLRTQVDF